MRTRRTTPTPREQKIYDYIVAFKRKHDGNSPSIRQIGDHAGIDSTSVVNYHLDRLKRLGLIERGTRDFRMISVVGGAWLPPTTAGK